MFPLDFSKTIVFLSFVPPESPCEETSKSKNDVFIVNLLFCKDINVKKELNGAENPNQEPKSIDLQQVSHLIALFSMASHHFLLPVKQKSPERSREEEANGERAQSKRQ